MPTMKGMMVSCVLCVARRKRLFCLCNVRGKEGCLHGSCTQGFTLLWDILGWGKSQPIPGLPAVTVVRSADTPPPLHGPHCARRSIIGTPSPRGLRRVLPRRQQTTVRFACVVQGPMP